MAEFPVLPLFTDALKSDTDHLTTIEFGAYLKLLITAWRSRGCRLPDDDAMLARYTKLTRAQWTRMKPIIAPFFDIADGFWTQRRLTDEFNHVRQVRESQVAAGRASARAKSLRTQGRHSTGVATDAQQPNQQALNGRATPSPSPSPREGDDGDSTIINVDPEAQVTATFGLLDLTDRLARVGGVRHISPGEILRNQVEVKGWLELGADVETVIIPTIRQAVMNTADPVRSLKYFDAAIRRAVAAQEAGASGFGSSKPVELTPAEQATRFEEQAEWFASLERHDDAERCRRSAARIRADLAAEPAADPV